MKTNKLNGRHNRMMRKPLQAEGAPTVPGDSLCIFNTDVSVAPLRRCAVAPGEAEGSLLATLEALLLCHGVTVPNFPAAYYNKVVSQVF